MWYAREFHLALMAVSSAFMAAAGIIAAILISRESISSQVGRQSIRLILRSIVPGIVSIIFVLFWFYEPWEAPTFVAMVALVFQFLLMYIALRRLVRDLEKRG